MLFQRLSSLVSLKCLTSSLLREIVEEACGLLESEVAAHTCVSTEAVHGGGRSEERNGLEELLHMGTSTSVKRRKKRNNKKSTTKKRKLSTLSEAGNTVIDLTCDSDDGEDEEELDKVENQTNLFNRHCSCYPRSWRLRYNPGSVCVSVLSLCMESWEKLRDYVEANCLLVLLLSQSVFGYYKRGHWWERLALNLDSHLKEKSKVKMMIAVIVFVLCLCKISQGWELLVILMSTVSGLVCDMYRFVAVVSLSVYMSNDD